MVKGKRAAGSAVGKTLRAEIAGAIVANGHRENP
jgi:hypothetical protein